MIYRYITPSPILQEYVRDYLIADFVFNKDQIPVKAFAPRPEQAITFIPVGNLKMVNLSTKQTKDAPQSSICGQQFSRYDFHVTREYRMVRINFRPGALFRLFRIPLFEFADTWFDAGAAINAEINFVNERLTNVSSYPGMINIVEDYLKAKIKWVRSDIDRVDKVASYILNSSKMASLDWLARQACLCQRQIDRKFIERIGVTPKLFCRVVRFFNAYKYKEAHSGEDWLSVALLFGYTDYQHMVKDFKQFTLVTPNLWVSQDTRSPEKILSLT